jgi:hypothetical protein
MGDEHLSWGGGSRTRRKDTLKELKGEIKEESQLWILAHTCPACLGGQGHERGVKHIHDHLVACLMKWADGEIKAETGNFNLQLKGLPLCFWGVQY